MSTTIIMPQLGESVAEGVIGKWLKSVGDSVAKDEPIVEVITDKVNAEIPSPVAGVLEKITQQEGATVAVGQEIAVIGAGEGGQVTAQGEGAQSTTGNGQSGGNGSSGPAAPSGAVETSAVSSSAPVAVAEAPAARERGERVRTSPLVKRLAEQYGINLAEVPGTGIGGRVSKQDILSFIEQKEREPQEAQHLAPTGAFERPAAQAATGAPQAPPAAPQLPPRPAPRAAGANEELVPVSPLRKMIAERMVLSKFTIPHATTMSDVDMTRVVRFREAHKDEFRQREGVPLSYVAFVIKATVDALKQFPYVNAEWAGDNIILKKDININVAVDAPEGLTTPVIHHADDMSLAGLSKAIYDLAVRARDKKLRVEDMQGGTFTVNNTGALGSVSGVSIINYPQGGILSAGAIVKKPVVMEVDGEDVIAVRHIMNLSFSFDHRLLDGGAATSFVNAVQKTLETWPEDYPIY
jgi:2-oxoisovalerate dehydrogenase E2 component (dihydrolipoyl transacylase)